MDVVKSLTSGKNGSKRFVERYDAEQQISYTTVERKHKPPKTRTQSLKQPTALVFLRVGFH